MNTPARVSEDSPQRIDTLGIVLRHWVSIVAWVVGVTVAAGGLSFLLPKTYRATAYLLINPSPYKSSSLEQAPLEVDVYERILRSPELVQDLREQLRLEEMNVEQMRKKMIVRLVKRASVRETAYAPLLQLEVEDEKPEKCRDIANAWAELATSTSWRIKSGVIKQDNERIRKQFDDTRRLLEAKEDELTTFDITAQLVERKAELEIVRKQLSAEQDNLGTLRLELSVAQTRLDDLKKKYDSFFVQGEWVGMLFGADDKATISLGREDVEPLAVQFLLARNDFLDKSTKFTNYKIKERVDIVKRQYDILNDKIIRFEQDIEDMRLTLSTSQAKLTKLEENITSMSDHLIVSKAITDEALWSALTSQVNSLDELTSKRLTTEVLNPVWLSMHARIEYLKPEIASIEARIKAHEALMTQLQGEQSSLDMVVVRQTQDSENLQTEMLLAKDRYETLFQLFLQISHNVMYQESEVARLAEEITNSLIQVDRLTSASMTLNDYTVKKETLRLRLDRDLKNMTNVFTLIATKYEEARITELEVTGDLQISNYAVRPDDKIKPRRSMIVMTAFLCSLILFSMLAVAREYARQQAA